MTLREDLEELERRTGMRWRIRGELDVPDAFALRTALVVSSAAAAGVTHDEVPPDLYDPQASRQVRYQLDPRGCNMTVPWWTVLERGSGDCQDLTAWRAAKRYREAGRWPVFMLEHGGRPGLIHVRLEDEDPSKRLARAGRFIPERRDEGPECTPGVWPGQRDRQPAAGACGCPPQAGAAPLGAVLDIIKSALGGGTAAVDAASNAKHGTGTGTGTGRTSAASEWERLIGQWRGSSSSSSSSSTDAAKSSSSSAAPASSSSTPAPASSSSSDGLMTEILGLIGAIGGAVSRDKATEAGAMSTRASRVARHLADWDGGKRRKVIEYMLKRLDVLGSRGQWTVSQVRELRAVLEELAGEFGDTVVTLGGPQVVRPGALPSGSGSGPVLVKPGEAPRTGTNPATGKPWRTWQTVGQDGKLQTWQAGAVAPRGAKARRAYALSLRSKPAPPSGRPAGQSTRGYVSERFGGPGLDVEDIRAAGESVALLTRLLELYD